MRYNELFKRLQQSSPQLAHMIELNPAAMAELDNMERDRVAAEVGSLLEKFVSGLFVENRS
jgi:hypothetical protein